MEAIREIDFIPNRKLAEAILRSMTTHNGVKTGEIDVDLINLEPSYQRGEMKNVGRIAKEWDNNKAGFIVVSLRRDDWTFNCIDGANRVRAAKIVGQKTVNCILYDKLDEQTEAVIFSEQDKNKCRVSSSQRFVSDIVAKNPISLAISRVCDEYGIRYKKVYNRQLGSLVSISAAEQIYKTHGENGLRWVFSVIKEAGWHTSLNAYSDTILCALNVNYLKLPASKAAAILKAESPDMIMRKGMVAYPDRGRKRATAAYLEVMLGGDHV